MDMEYHLVDLTLEAEAPHHGVGVGVGSDESGEKTAKIKVLTKIAGYLSARDLMTARQTCKEWNSAFIPELRKKHQTITLASWTTIRGGSRNMYGGSGIMDTTKMNTESNDLVLKAFTEVMKASVEIPFSKYKLCDYREGLEEFATVCGETVTELSIRGLWYGKWEENWETSEVRRAIFEQMPQLTELSLEFVERKPSLINKFKHWITSKFGQSSQNNGHDEESPLSTTMNQVLPKLKRFFFLYTNQQPTACSQLVAKMIQSATELGVLQLLKDWSHNPDSAKYYDFLCGTFVQMLDSNRNVHKLNELWIGNINASILQILLKLADSSQAENCLRLDMLEISITGSEWKQHQLSEMTRMLETFLATQAPTLLGLTIYLTPQTHSGSQDVNVGNSMIIPIFLPQMERLSLLAILGGWDSRKRVPFALHYEGDTLVSTLPSLDMLHYYFNYQDVDAASPSDLNMSRQTELVHHGVTQLSVKASLQHLVLLPTRFLSVTRLHLSLNHSPGEDADEVQTAMGHLWTMWPRLTHAHLSCFWDLETNDSDAAWPDELLTGIARHQMAQLKLELDHLTSDSADQLTLDKLGTLVQKYKTKPSIGDLRLLQEFSLDLHTRPLIEKDSMAILSISGITDIGCYCGLALIGSQLQRIRIGGSVNNIVSESCLQFMKSDSVLGPNAVLEISNVRF